MLCPHLWSLSPVCSVVVSAPWVSACLQDLENQMHIAEQKRRTLLKDFHDTWSDCNSPASPSLCPLPHLLPSTTVSQPCWLSCYALRFAFFPLPPLCLTLSLDIMLQGDRNAPLSLPFLHLFILVLFWIESISFPAVKLVIVLKFDYRVGLLRSFWKSI